MLVPLGGTNPSSNLGRLTTLLFNTLAPKDTTNLIYPLAHPKYMFEIIIMIYIAILLTLYIGTFLSLYNIFEGNLKDILYLFLPVVLLTLIPTILTLSLLSP